MNMPTPPQLAFEPDTLDEAVIEVMRMAKHVGQKTVSVTTPAYQEFDLQVAGQVRDYVMRAAQEAYAAVCRDRAVQLGFLEKAIYRGTYLVIERLQPDELRRLVYDKALSEPVHVAQFWKRLGAD